MTCADCMVSFLFTPWKIGVILFSVALSISFLVLMKRSQTLRTKLMYLYLHLFTGVFPITFYVFYRGCQTLFSQCQSLQPIFIMLLMTGISTLFLSVIIAPILFIRRHMNNSIERPYEGTILARSAQRLAMEEPRLYVVNEQRPLAFSIAYWKAKIFISVGLIELMSKKELEAILLHELGHIQRHSSTLKFSASLFHIFSPFRQFASFQNELQEEEYLADQVAWKVQGTMKHILSAREKVRQYEDYKQYGLRYND